MEDYKDKYIKLLEEFNKYLRENKKDFYTKEDAIKIINSDSHRFIIDLRDLTDDERANFITKISLEFEISDDTHFGLRCVNSYVNGNDMIIFENPLRRGICFFESSIYDIAEQDIVIKPEQFKFEALKNV